MCNLFTLSCLIERVDTTNRECLCFVYIILYIAAQTAALVDNFLIGLGIALILLLLAFSKFRMSVKWDICKKKTEMARGKTLCP